MIQRRQSIFLLLAFIAGLWSLMIPVAAYEPEGMQVATLVYSLLTVGGTAGGSFIPAPLFALELIASCLALITIFLYRNRRLQIRLCGTIVLLQFLWYVYYAVIALAGVIPGTDGMSFAPRMAAILPLIAIILSVMARSGVKADERLIRSADRIR